MSSTFINPIVNPDAPIGTNAFSDSDCVVLDSQTSAAGIELVIRSVYKQVLGNAYVMESERLTVPESQLQNRSISVREFVRQVALSPLYQSRFFENCNRTRAIELNFKHLLGRAPESYEELSLHGQILDQGGFVAEIESYIDSPEYNETFGENTVPYYRGYRTQTGRSMVGFTHLLQLLRGASSSDKTLTQTDLSRLNRSLITNQPSPFIPISSAPSDPNRLITQALSSNTASQTIPTYLPPAPIYTAAIPISSNYSEQQTIAQLEQQLAELRPLANLAASTLKSDWQPDLPTPRTTAETIANLKSQITAAQTYATIANAQLNKWRKY